MKILQGLLLSFLGFLLGITLILFGAAYTVRSTALNPAFIRTEINELDFAGLFQEFTVQNLGQPITNETVYERQIVEALSDTITGMRPPINERLTAATDQIYDYLLGKKPNPDLAATLRATVLKKDLATGFIDKIDLGTLIRQTLKQQLSSLPPEYENFTGAAWERTITAITPQLKQQLEVSSDLMLDYLVGKTANFSATINVPQFSSTLKTSMHDAVLANPPTQLNIIPLAQREAVLNQLIDNYTRGLQNTITLDQSILGPDIRAAVIDGITAAEEGLVQAKPYVGYFQTGYILLVALMLILAALIVLVYREVRGSSRYLAITFLCYGVVDLAIALGCRYLIANTLPQQITGIPDSVQIWITNLLNRIVSPMMNFSIFLLVLGVVLLVVSFVYPKRSESAGQSAI